MSPARVRAKSTPSAMDRERVERQLERILASPDFQSADRLSRLLRYLVQNALDHPGATIKEYALGVDVFDRSEDFDPKVDSVVRVQAGRLRQKLAKYYEGPGSADPVRIDLPRGGYSATLSVVGAPEAGEQTVATPTPRRFWLTLAAAGVMILAGAGWVFWGRTKRPEAPVVTQLTSEVGVEDDAAFSPDGESIAYSATVGLGRDIFVKSVREGGVRRLTDDHALNVHPSWSPDGSTIAFSRHNGEVGYAIWLVPAQGGAERKIGDTRSTIGHEFSTGPVWTRDGRLIVVADKAGTAGPDSLFLLDVSTGARKRLTQPGANDIGDCAAAISPSGQTIAFARFTSYSTGDIYTMSIDGGAEQRITRDRATIRGIDFTADGGSLVFSSSRGGTQRLWRVRLPNGSPEPFSTAGLNAIHPAVARFGRRVVYTEYGSIANVWRADLTRPAAAGEMLIGSTREQDSAHYSPDGKRIAFVSDRSGNTEIWTSFANGQDVRRLTRFDGPLVGTPRWSPDGTSIAFDARAQGRSNIYVVSADGGAPRRVTDADADRMMPSWSADGLWLFVASRTNGLLDIWRVSPADGTSSPVTQNRGFDGVQPPGRNFLVYTKQRMPGFWQVQLDGTREQVIPELATVEAHRYWTVSGKGLYFAAGDRPPFAVSFFDFDSRRVREVVRIPGKLVTDTPSLDVSPDGRYLLYSQVDSINGDLMLVEHW